MDAENKQQPATKTTAPTPEAVEEYKAESAKQTGPKNEVPSPPVQVVEAPTASTSDEDLAKLPPEDVKTNEVDGQDDVELSEDQSAEPDFNLAPEAAQVDEPEQKGNV